MWYFNMTAYHFTPCWLREPRRAVQVSLSHTCTGLNHNGMESEVLYINCLISNSIQLQKVVIESFNWTLIWS